MLEKIILPWKRTQTSSSFRFNLIKTTARSCAIFFSASHDDVINLNYFTVLIVSCRNFHFYETCLHAQRKQYERQKAWLCCSINVHYCGYNGYTPVKIYIHVHHSLNNVHFFCN